MCRRNRRRYAYAFDNVGNRGAATEAGTQFAYVTNDLNQYPALTKTPAEGQTQYFTPTYDADGNATLFPDFTGRDPDPGARLARDGIAD